MNDLPERLPEQRGPLPADIVNRHNLALIADALQKSGISELTVRFDGLGDSGQIDEVVTEPPDIPLTQMIEGMQTISGYCLDPDTTRSVLEPRSFSDALDHHIHAYLSFEHPGWELDEGSYGVFKITPAGSELDFYIRHTEHEFDECTPQLSPLDTAPEASGLPEPSPHD